MSRYVLDNKMQEYAKDLLFELISCNTTDYQEINGLAVIERELAKLSLAYKKIIPDPEALSGKYPEFNIGHTYKNRYCLEVTVKGSGEGKSLILNAHIDTVLPNRLDEWLTDPFMAVEADGKIFGLGACDTKAGLAAIIVALKIIKRLKLIHKGDIIVHFVVDEEAGGGNGTLACIDAGTRADAVVVFEPTNLIPGIAHIGSYAAIVQVAGKSAHANLKSEGVNAIEKSVSIIRNLLELGNNWSQRTHTLLPSPQLSVLSIKGGDGSMSIPGECEFLINYTYLPDEYPYEDEFINTLKEYENSDEWLKQNPLKVIKHHDVKPYDSMAESRIGVLASSLLSISQGKTIKTVGLGFGADARFYANIGQMDTIVIGPGNILNAHSPNEHVESSQFFETIELIVALVEKWCNQK